jgi:hypothetical protein
LELRRNGTSPIFPSLKHRTALAAGPRTPPGVLRTGRAGALSVGEQLTGLVAVDAGVSDVAVDGRGGIFITLGGTTSITGSVLVSNSPEDTHAEARPTLIVFNRTESPSPRGRWCSR